MHATYSPEDNKLRLYSESRLDSETYGKVKAAGFKWAPKQDLFVAPMWTPAREDLLIALCGEIGDEDTSLVERAEQRAERFEQYSENRASDAHSAKQAVSAIADGIPLGQPILVGHHSERRARKDAERIENGMRRAVKMWEQSKYWTDRAAGAVAAAKYKELPGVRARRIKGIEADKRKTEREIQKHERSLRFWRGEMRLANRETGAERTLEITEENKELIHNFLRNDSEIGWLTCVRLPDGRNYHSADVLANDEQRYKDCPAWTVAQVQERALRVYANTIKHLERWINHYNNRLAYERAMLNDGGGLTGEKFQIVPGGRVCLNRRGGEWYVVRKVIRKDGAVFSVGVFGYFRTIKIEEISDYKPPQEGDWEKVREVSKTPPLCNYPGEGFLHQTKAEFEATQPKWSDFPKTHLIKRGNGFAPHRVRNQKKPGAEYHKHVPVFITDMKRTDPPKDTGAEAHNAVVDMMREAKSDNAWTQPATATPKPADDGADFKAMRDSLKQGVQVVSAPQLFPTPDNLAQQMADSAELCAGDRVLEPSAGTGRILGAVIERGIFRSDCVAVEINLQLANGLRSQAFDVRCCDFLQCNGDLGKFDVVLMNPPFANGQDIAHIKHALTFLKPGGRLVAICANGPRQQAQLKPIVDERGGEWIDLPAGTFQDSGTNVNTAMIIIDAE